MSKVLASTENNNMLPGSRQLSGNNSEKALAICLPFSSSSSDDSKPNDRKRAFSEAPVFHINNSGSPRKKKRKMMKGKAERKSPGSKAESGKNSDLWTHRIPPELLLKIFQYVTDEEGAIPFTLRIARVCTTWSSLSKHPSLWKKVDLSYGWVKSVDKTLTYLCSKRLGRVQELSLNSWKNLTDAGLECIAEHCPLLQILDISHCSKVRGQALQSIATNCHHIARLNIAFLNADVVNPQTMKSVIQACGTNLVALEMGGNKFRGFNVILNALIESCPNLEVLDVSNSLFSTDFMMLNIEKLQSSLRKIRVLRFANSKFRATTASSRAQADGLGFPDLEELSIAMSPEAINAGIGIDDIFIFRLLKKSAKVRLLDLRGSSHLTSETLHALPITDLEHLYLSQSSVAKYAGIEVVMHKWQHSLKELDLSWNIYPGASLDLAMGALSKEPCNSQLEILNLSGTSISPSRVKSLLEGCPNLKTLNLASCRGLTRGMKREYSGVDLDRLRRDIDSFIENDT